MKIFSKHHSKYLWYDFTLRGRRYRGSTKETNRTRAEAIASIKLTAVLEETDPLARKAPLLRNFAVRFLDSVEHSNLDHDTKRYYKNGWGMLADTKLANLRLNTIEQEVVDTVSFPGGPANINRARRTLRRMLHKAEDWKLIRRAPKLKLVTEHPRWRRLDGATEQKLVLGAAACQWRPRALALFTDIVMLVRDTGMRDERELFAMRVEHLDFDRRLIFVPDSKTPSGRREIPMTTRVYGILRGRCGTRTAGWVFPSTRSACGHLTTVAHHFREARRQAGLPEELVLYCGRHDFGTRLYAKTGNLKLVMAVMGHKDVKTAMRYQHPDLEMARAALEATAG